MAEQIKKYKRKSSLVEYANRHQIYLVSDYEEFQSIKATEGIMNEIAYCMDICGNKVGAIWQGDNTKQKYFCTNPSALIRI